LISLLSLTAFVQLPFVIGQSLLRKYILDNFASSARGDVESKLNKDEFAPLLKKPEALTAIFTLGTGGLLIIIVENFVKELFK
jgi:hypothetical protein